MSKPRIIIWFVTSDGRYIGKAGETLEQQFNGVEVVGVTATQKISINEAPFIPLNEISVNGGGGVCDIILVAGAKNLGMAEVTKFAKAIGLNTEKLLADWIVCIPGFTLQKYRQLQRSQLSIFAMNCFGGHISHLLTLPFRTPFINMYTSDQEFIHFLRAPNICVKENLILKKMVWNETYGYHHPVAMLCNIDLVLNHDPDFEKALAKWNRRKQRINWYNLFVTCYTEKQNILEEFDTLPFGKKVCFVPFKSDLDSAFYINLDLTEKLFNKKVPLWYVVNAFAKGEIFYYDPFDMLLYGKKTPLIEM